MRSSEILKLSCIDDWNDATKHSFCAELASGTLPNDKMRLYLAQDYTFIDNFIRLAGCAIHHAPSLSDRLPLAQFLGVISGPENTYFQRSFEALDVIEKDRIKPDLLPSTYAFQSLMLEAADSGCYGSMIAVLCAAEWSYLSWAEPFAPAPAALPFYYGEWITLHSGCYFESVVEHLRIQLDNAYDKSDSDQKNSISGYFRNAVLLEKEFFDATYR
ncbi:MAG: thiaminase/transcriptional activator TenA [Urechidicola sp.]|jgi:thiaminase/transcriptional activator TenA